MSDIPKTIELKFDVQDIIWFLHGNVVHTAEVLRVEVQRTKYKRRVGDGEETYANNSVNYHVRPNQSDKAPGRVSDLDLHESQCFASKADLLASL